MRAKVLSVAVLAIGLLGAGVVGANASVTNYPTVFVKFKLETKNGKRSFSGQIDSNKGKCVKDRTVKLIRKHNGNKDTVGKDKTNDKGKFDISLPKSQVKNGKYYAKAKKKKFDSGKKVCLDRESGSIKVS